MSDDQTVRIAMWSGPRNISTAMMRAFENRPDCAVVDEPFYGFYLDRTGLDHPGRDAVIQAQPTDWRAVVAALKGPAPGGAPIWYQKHMAHHMLPEIAHDWLDGFRHAFLIRDPRTVVASYVRTRPSVAPADIGLDVQLALFRAVRESQGTAPPVIDSADVLKAPEAMLQALCAALEIPFHQGMLSWRAGPRDSDGVWAPHWYDDVRASTGFAPYKPAEPVLTEAEEAVAAAVMPAFEALREHRLAV